MSPAMQALRPYVKGPLYFEIHRIGEFTARSLDIDVVLDLMIHDLDIVQWLVGADVEVTDVRAVGIPVLTPKVDAANAKKTEIGWGHQIRSYVLQPYQLVKDLRTGHTSTNPSAVLDGEVDDFIQASLSHRIRGGEDVAVEDIE